MPRQLSQSLLRSLLSAALLALAGCATEKGAILPGDPGYYFDASFIEVPDDQYFWLAAVPAGQHQPEPVQEQVPKTGMWVKAGWMNVESQCYAPKKAPHQDYPIFGNFLDAVPVYVKPGLRYLLACNDYRVGSFDLLVEGKLSPP
jgi:hypothetical protein